MTTKLGFRSDINGLRAIAVLAVMAFHFGVQPFSGGFVGVDVFFVISGYLMTGIILNRQDRGTFSLLGFYLDRARRIIPALAVLVAAMLVLGAAILLPDEYLILSKHAGSSVLFASNILYWKQLDYFGPGVEQLWLLHTWSLSVEWQFYLIYPLLLMALCSVRQRLLLPILAVLAVASFVCLISWADSPQAAFFLLPARAWEMLVGSLVFLSPPLPGKTARVGQLVGLAVIVAAAVFTPSDGWPNAWALAPVAGTALVILAGRSESRITGNAVAKWLGLNSYSIYLWHWPVCVLLRRSGHLTEWPWIVAGVAASLLLGHLSWRFIERRVQPHTAAPRIHTGKINVMWRSYAGFAAPVLVLALVSAGIWVTRGLPHRFSAEVLAVVGIDAPSELVGADDCFSDSAVLPPCRLPEGAPTVAYLLGDSHAHSLALGLVSALPKGTGVTFNAYAGCPPVLGATPLRAGSHCDEFLDQFLKPQTVKRTTPLVLTARWSNYLATGDYRFTGGAAKPSPEDFTANLVRSSCALAAAGPTYIVMPTPEFPFEVTRELQRRLARDTRTPDITQPLSEHAAYNRRIIAALESTRRCGVRLLDPTPYVCPNGVCEGSRDHHPLYRDGNHTSDYGTRLLIPMFRQVFAGNE